MNNLVASYSKIFHAKDKQTYLSEQTESNAWLPDRSLAIITSTLVKSILIILFPTQDPRSQFLENPRTFWVPQLLMCLNIEGHFLSRQSSCTIILLFVSLKHVKRPVFQNKRIAVSKTNFQDFQDLKWASPWSNIGILKASKAGASVRNKTDCPTGMLFRNCNDCLALTFKFHRGTSPHSNSCLNNYFSTRIYWFQYASWGIEPFFACLFFHIVQTPSSSSGKLVVPRQPTKENMSLSLVEKNSIEVAWLLVASACKQFWKQCWSPDRSVIIHL